MGTERSRRRQTRYLRFGWSHQHPVHRLAVRSFNAAVRFLPFGVKYGIGRKLRRHKPPYALIRPGSVVVQIGAPKDTLRAGRSRAVYFSQAAGPEGKVVCVEPDVDSLNEYRSTLEQRGMRNAIFCPVAAWSEKTALTVYISDLHPASSFTEGTKEYQADRLKRFRPVLIEADTLDNILADVGLAVIDLVSITTNGAEQEILKGMKHIMEAGLPFISLARTSDDHTEVMRRLGYDLYSHDDRGFTFERRG